MDQNETLTGLGGLAASLSTDVHAARDHLDKHGEIPGKLLHQLREAGAFRLLTPRELGGVEAPLPTVLGVYEEFGRLDASVAWLIWNGNWGFIGALLDTSGIGQIWTEAKPDPVFANSGTPGIATPAVGGYMISGTWRIVSGIN
ncbi:MAG: acyl-CoA dehydrogenase family protein, partial [Trebonia sp.]